MATDTSVYPGGKTYSQKFTYVNGSYRNIMEYNIDGMRAGIPVTIRCWVKHDSTGLTEAQRLHCQILDYGHDPMRGGTALAETIASDSDAWQLVTVTYTPTTEQPLIFRVAAIRASGNAWFIVDSVRGAGGSNLGGQRIILF